MTTTKLSRNKRHARRLKELQRQTRLLETAWKKHALATRKRAPQMVGCTISSAMGVMQKGVSDDDRATVLWAAARALDSFRWDAVRRRTGPIKDQRKRIAAVVEHAHEREPVNALWDLARAAHKSGKEVGSLGWTAYACIMSLREALDALNDGDKNAAIRNASHILQTIERAKDLDNPNVIDFATARARMGR